MILQIAIPAPLYHYFDYLPPSDHPIDQITIGSRVRVPFGKREIIGFVANIKNNPDTPLHKLKPAIEILDTEPLLPPKLLELIQWASGYYHYPLGEVFAAAIPTLLRKSKSSEPTKKRKKTLRSLSQQETPNELSITLNIHQQQAIQNITQALGRFQTFLLNGITGSGKTEVYLQVIATLLSQGKQALILVPEISLTPQTAARFQQRFNVPIALLHSGMTERERLDNWLLAKTGIAPIVIGTRSVIFTPLLNPGIIIIDEEHDLSFKQQEGFRYSARDLAIVRAQFENIPVLLGSATPSLESYYNAQQNRYQQLTLPERVGDATHPQFQLIDLRNQKLENGLSNQLLNTIKQHLQNQAQVLIFLNRRGFSPVYICHACGWIADCKRCDAKMILHKNPSFLQCHHCGSTRKPELKCPQCNSQQLFNLGLGTQRLEQTLQEHFPNTGIVRIDRDSTRRKGTLHDMLETIHSGENKILIGTQMLAKGHHFPDVTLVAVLDADGGLFSADFRASERIAQLLMQVSGRAGRAEKTGEVLIQTYHPEHPLLLHLIHEGYESFAKLSLQERQAAALPPFNFLTLIRAEAVNQAHPTQFLTEVKKLAQQLSKNHVAVLGPIPSLMERRAGRYRMQLLLQTAQRNHLHNLLNKLVIKISELPTARKVRWSVDVDPQEML